MGHASLNKIYRLVWSHVQQGWVIVSECTRGRGKRVSRRLLASAALAFMGHAVAGPSGGTVTAGSGTVTQSGTTTTVNQTSQNLSLNWQSFNTSSQETVNFVQPSASAIAVNRIADTSATQFFGHLNANGQVYLINPNGVLFGAGAQINVGGLVASTLDIADAHLGSATRTFSGSGTGSILNQGSIRTQNGGYVAFIGNSVKNQGNIQAPGGAVAFGAGSDVTLAFSGNNLVKLQVNQSTLNNLADNGGLIQADGGAVLLSAGARDAVLASVVNNTGIIQARSVQNVNGTIVLDGGNAGAVSNSGKLDASGKNAGESGGTVKVLGRAVTLAAGSSVDISGDAGGGTALVGGNFLGAGPEQNALATTVAADATINADAISSGNGGSVAIWSDGSTSFNGSITARGGAHSGNGGQIETSGHKLKVGASALVSTAAPNGHAGNWLLDPADITIGNMSLWGSAFNIDVDSVALTRALNSGDVTIKTTPGGAGNGDIRILDFIGAVNDYNNSGFVYNWTGANALTISAYRDIHFVTTSGVRNVADPSGSSTWGGGIEVDGPGKAILKADNAARGVGTVRFDDNFNSFLYAGPASSTINIYYSAANYVPIDYNIYNGGGLGAITAYMAVNVNALIANKTYDGTTSAIIQAAPAVSALPGGVTVNTSGASALFSDKNAATNKTVILNGISFGSGGTTTTDGNGNHYYLNGLDSATATISKASLTATATTASNKTYDGTSTATVTGTVSAIGTDQVSLNVSNASFSDKNVGTNKAITATYTLSGADAGNYDLIAPTGLTASIAKANVSVTGATANSKMYDATTAATVSGGTVAAFGSDVVSLAFNGASFSDKNAGSNKAVTATYALTGTDAGNYNLIQPTGLTATITKASLTVAGISAAGKTYDTTSAATLTGTASVAALGSDVVSVTGSGVGLFADKNAGANKTVLVSGYLLTGTDAGNYNIVQPTGLSATINRANLNVSGITANNKTYDSTAFATLSGTASVTALGSDVVSVTGSGVASFGNKNAGNAKAVTVSGFSLAGSDASNYNIVQPTGLVATISKANLAVGGVSANNKTYDATTGATLTGTASVAALGSDVVSVSGGVGAFIDKNAGANKVVTASGFTLSGSDAGNYNIIQPTGLRATINKANLVVGGVNAVDKTYDTTTVATLAGTASVAALGSDAVSVIGAGTASFANKNAGANKAVAVTGYSLTGSDAGNYTLIQPTGLSATISKATLNVTGISASDKVYDSTTAATLSGTASVSALGSDVVSLGGTGVGNFSDKNAGSNKAVTVTGYTLGGTDAGNYNLIQSSGVTANIAKANLAVGGVSATNKTYDSTTAATLTGTATVSAIGGDVVAVSGIGATGSFADKNAGANKAVTVAGYALMGADAGNYNIIQPIGLRATINKANLVVGGVNAVDKTYDTTTVATLAGTASVAALGSDTVSVIGAGIASFANKNAGANKAVAVTGYSLTGSDAGNYTLIQPTGLSATISKATLNVTGISASDKVYDSTTAATLSGTASVSALGSDVVSLGGTGVGNFSDKNAGSNKAVTVTGYTLGGTDAGNYNLLQSSGVTANIAKANLAVGGVSAANKTYDSTTAATLTGTATVSAIGGDVVAVSGIGATGSFADKNAGANKAVTVAGYALMGADAGNYNVIQPTGLAATINKADLAVSGVGAANKTYDATAAASLTGVATVSAIGGDMVSISGMGATGNFADKNAGTNKAVTVTGYTLTGADAGNYNVIQPTGLTATINKADLIVSGVSAGNKTYDATTTAVLSGVAAVSAMGTDMVSLTGSGTGNFSDKNAGANKAVTVTGYTLTGTDAGNYNVVQPTGITATINKADLIVSGVSAANKTYDGTTTAFLTGAATVSAIGGDAVSISGTSATGNFADKNAGANKAVTVAGFTLAGTDAGNYNVVQPTGLTATINKADLVVSGVSAANKTYDGTTTASLTGAATISAIGGDVVLISSTGVTGSFTDKNAGSNKGVAVTGYTLTGADAGNYNVIQPSGLKATITKANVMVGGVGAADKTYDSTTAASLTGTATVSALSGDVVSISAASASGSFADKNAGSNKGVVVTGYTLTGADAGNYNLIQPTGLAATINKADLAISGVSAVNKTYDGTTAASLTGAASVSALAGDVVSVSGTGAIGNFADKNTGRDKSVAVAGYTLTGPDAANYNVVQPTEVTASITPANLDVFGITASNKVFDGTTSATVSTLGSRLEGLVAGDSVSLMSAGLFSDAAVGSGKTVNLRNTLLGSDSGNYRLTGQETAFADITSATPPMPGTTLRNVLTQVQSTVLPTQASAQPQSLSLSSTIVVERSQEGPEGDTPRLVDTRGGSRTTINTNTQFGTLAPRLNIQSGGVSLPPLAVSVSN